MNRYFSNGVAYQEKAETIEQAKEAMFFSCFGRGGLKDGCHFQGNCDESRCPIMRAHNQRIVYLESGAQNIPISFRFSTEEPVEKKKQVLKPEYKAKVAVVKYLDRVIKKVAPYDRKLVILLENITVQIYATKDLYEAMTPLKKSYPEIYYKAARLYWKYGV